MKMNLIAAYCNTMRTSLYGDTDRRSILEAFDSVSPKLGIYIIFQFLFGPNFTAAKSVL